MKETLHVTIEVVPWLTDYFENKGYGRYRTSEAVPRGTTILDILKRLAEQQPRFGKIAFPAGGEFTTAISILVNGRWLQSGDRLDRQLEDKDVITLLPAFTGGTTEV